MDVQCLPDTIAEILRQAEAWLAPASDSPRRDVEILLGAVLDKDRAFLYAYGETTLDTTARDLLAHYLARRSQGEPVAYIIGQREFWSLLLHVNDSTLIPRPDTETLVERALQLCLGHSLAVLDLGTGTGAIAAALASEHPDWHIEAVDCELEAVELAQLNMARHQLTNVTVYQSDWFSRVPEASRRQPPRFDLIVSNPPYIDAEDPHLLQGDVRFEPRRALVAGEHGYSALHTIAREARAFLQPGGWLLLEHGYQQADRVREYLRACGYVEVHTVTDVAGHERVTAGRWP